MKVEKILILLGPPKSVFSEILIKYLKKKFSKKSNYNWRFKLFFTE